MRTGRAYLLVEGHGEASGAANNLIARLSPRCDLHLPWFPARRWPNLHLRQARKHGGLLRGARWIREHADAAALLVLRDEDDACPATRGPEMARWLADLELAFPAAVVLLYREFETLFLPCVAQMAGRPLVGPDGQQRPGLRADARWEGDAWDRRRDAKGWLSSHMPRGRAYKPTLDQLPMTRMIDLDVLEASGLSCFGTLCRALRFLGENLSTSGQVYPAPEIVGRRSAPA